MTSFSSQERLYSFFDGVSTWPTVKLIDYLFEREQTVSLRPWSRDSWQSLLQEAGGYLLVAQGSLDLVSAMALFRLIGAENLAHLLKFTVFPEFRRQGNGQDLLVNSIKYLEETDFKKIYLEVEEKNRPALNLYYKCGLIPVHRKSNFYGDDRDVIVMTTKESGLMT